MQGRLLAAQPAALEQRLGELNIPLLIRTAATWNQAPGVLSELCRDLSARSLHVNEEYGIHESPS